MAWSFKIRLNQNEVALISMGGRVCQYKTFRRNPLSKYVNSLKQRKNVVMELTANEMHVIHHWLSQGIEHYNREPSIVNGMKALKKRFI